MAGPIRTWFHFREVQYEASRRPVDRAGAGVLGSQRGAHRADRTRRTASCIALETDEERLGAGDRLDIASDANPGPTPPGRSLQRPTLRLIGGARCVSGLPSSIPTATPRRPPPHNSNGATRRVQAKGDGRGLAQSILL